MLSRLSRMLDSSSSLFVCFTFSLKLYGNDLAFASIGF